MSKSRGGLTAPSDLEGMCNVGSGGQAQVYSSMIRCGLLTRWRYAVRSDFVLTCVLLGLNQALEGCVSAGCGCDLSVGRLLGAGGRAWFARVGNGKGSRSGAPSTDALKNSIC
ncbi:MAG: hypothetical protein WBD99_06655 [Thermodesulfobacteriota bacterium]